MNNDLFEYAEKANIQIEYVDLNKNKALSVKIGDSEYIGIDKNVAADSKEERTLLVHEIGHCATDSFYSVDAPALIRSRQENRAVRWALLHYVPKAELITLLKKQYKNNEIADIFGVTESLIQTAYTYYFEYGIAG